jgi:hypothetical protein
MRTQVVRDEVKAFLKRVPFQPFVMTLESGQQLLIEHPENIAFNPDADPETKPVRRFVVVSGEHSTFSTFDAVSGITFRDNGDE